MGGSFMRKVMMMIGLILMVTIVFKQPVFADDDEYRKYEEHELEEENEAVEEGGEVLGWGTVAATAAAGTLFLLRRKVSFFTKIMPNGKPFFIQLLRLLTKWHISIGTIAVTLAAAHGILMYMAEGELTAHEYVGMVAVGLMTAAAVVGMVLAKNKRNSSIRATHMGLLLISGIFMVFHIVFS
jgi:hypothetical protein